ncbi:MAG: DUF2807 domain-containing protein [Candidatus Kapabacteria bacterium]|jgi:hypothetical protein|nr:DUF2807 domain-containing protein [Candidatus Kapabacteria bacterium]
MWAAILVLFAGVLGSCADEGLGSGRIVTQERRPGAFTAVASSSNIQLVLHRSEESFVRVATDDNLIDKIITTVENGILTVRSTEERLLSSAIEVDVYAPVFTGVDVEGRTSITCRDSIRTDVFRLSHRGSGTVTVERLRSDSMAITMTGESTAYFSSCSTGIARIQLAGTARYNAFGLYSDSAFVNHGGERNAEIFVGRYLYSRPSSTGDVVYIGSTTLTTDTIPSPLGGRTRPR